MEIRPIDILDAGLLQSSPVSDSYSYATASDASGTVIIDGDTASVKAIPCCNVQDGDRVLVLFHGREMIIPCVIGGASIPGGSITQAKMGGDQIYKVSEGTSGAWHYTKWSNGALDLWGKVTHSNVVFGSSAPPIYWSAAQMAELPDIGISSIETVHLEPKSPGVLLGKTIDNYSTSALVYYLERHANGDTISVEMHITIKGTWA